MRLNYLLKAVFTVILVIVLFQRINLDEVMTILSSINMVYLLESMFFIPILYLIRTYRWKILLNSIGINRPFANLFRVLMIGVFYGLVTPGKVGEIGRAYHLVEKKSATISTILMEKITDIIVLVVLSISTVFIFFDNYDVFKYLILICAISIFIFTLALTNKKLIFLFTKSFGTKEEDVNLHADSFLMLLTDRSAMFITILLAVIYYLIAYVFAYFLLISLNIDSSVVIALPIIILIGNVPITVSGLGLRESISAVCFVLLGESGEDGISFSILLFILMILLPGIFGYFMMFAKHDDIRYKGQITGMLSPFLERKRLAEIEKHIEGKRILDFGCGYGKLASILLDKEYVGVDIDKKVIDSAKERYNDIKNTKFYHIDEFKNVKEDFDTIVLSAVIEHVDDPAKFLTEIKRYLKKDGKIIITTPTPLANTILWLGSKFGLFSKEGFNEHASLLIKEDFIEVSSKTDLRLVTYQRFEFGLNQLVVQKNKHISDGEQLGKG